MILRSLQNILLFSCMGWSLLGSGSIAWGQSGTAAREVGEVIMKSLSKYLKSSTTRELGAELAEYGGEAAVKRLAQKAMSEGGEEAVQRIAVQAGKHGPETIRALQQSDAILPVLRSLDEIPEASVEAALKRLAASQGDELSKTITQYGTKALQTELAHPGVGTTLVRSLGQDGIELGEKLTREEALQLARYADEIATLPSSQKSGILSMLHQDAKGMVSFMGRFIEKNPGKTLFAASTTTIILAQPERILGGDDIVLDANGVPHLVSKPGLIGRTAEQASQSIIRPIMVYLAPILAIMIAGWLGIKGWFLYRSTKAAVGNLSRKSKASRDKNTTRSAD